MFEDDSDEYKHTEVKYIVHVMLKRKRRASIN